MLVLDGGEKSNNTSIRYSPDGHGSVVQLQYLKHFFNNWRLSGCAQASLSIFFKKNLIKLKLLLQCTEYNYITY